MGWEREFEHQRDYGHTWGPGIDDAPKDTDIVYSNRNYTTIAIALFSIDGDKFCDVDCIKEFDSNKIEYGVLENTLWSMFEGYRDREKFGVIAIPTYDGFYRTQLDFINCSDPILYWTVEFMEFEGKPYYKISKAQDCVLGEDTFNFNMWYGSAIYEKRLKEAAVPLPKYLTEHMERFKRLSDAITPNPETYYKAMEEFTEFRDQLVKIWEAKSGYELRQLSFCDKNLPNDSFTITVEKSEGGYIKHYGVLLTKHSAEDVAFVHICLQFLFGSWPLVSYKDMQGNLHHESVANNGKIKDSLYAAYVGSNNSILNSVLAEINKATTIKQEGKICLSDFVGHIHDKQKTIFNILKESGIVDKDTSEDIFVDTAGKETFWFNIFKSEGILYLQIVEYSGGIVYQIPIEDEIVAVLTIFKRVFNGDYGKYQALEKYDIPFVAYATMSAIKQWADTSYEEVVTAARNLNYTELMLKCLENAWNIVKYDLSLEGNDKITTYMDDSYSGCTITYFMEDNLNGAVSFTLDDDSPESAGGWRKKQIIGKVDGEWRVMQASSISDKSCNVYGTIAGYTDYWSVEFDKQTFTDSCHVDFVPISDRDVRFSLKLIVSDEDSEDLAEMSMKEFRQEILTLFETGQFLMEQKSDSDFKKIEYDEDILN